MDEIGVVPLEPNYCKHYIDLNIGVCHICDGTAIYTEQQLQAEVLKARKDELRACLANVPMPELSYEQVQNRIEMLTEGDS